MRLASIEGLSSLTIGRLAREVGVSRSGVFAHFRSKQRLQQEIIAAAQAVFEREVLKPGLDAPEGLAQLEGFCEAYLSYVEREVFLAAASSHNSWPSSTRPMARSTTRSSPSSKAGWTYSRA